MRHFVFLGAGQGRRQALVVLVLGLLGLQVFPTFAEIIPANRRTTWAGNVGVPGGIPSRTTVYTTISAGASLSTVQSAINSCPSNQVVQLSAGTYNFNGTLNLARNGVTLRGAGPGSTTISFSSGYLYIGNQAWYNDWGTPNSARHPNWTGGLAQGSTSIQVASAGDLAVGELIFMDEQNDANVDVVGACSGPVAGIYSSVAQPGVGADRWNFQMNRVMAINGTTITLSDPVYMPNYVSSLKPQIWWYAAQPIVMCGVENLTVVGSGGGSQGIYFQNTYGSWIKNVNVTNCRFRVNFLAALRCEMRHCYLYGPESTTDDYVVQTIASSGLLIEDNITSEGAWILQGLSGSVIAYNYLRKTTGQGGWMQGGFLTHGSNPNMNLFEGNYAPGLWFQNCWGSSEYNTAFRNRFIGKDEDSTFGLTDDIQAVQVGYWQRNMNIIGNVNGTTGFNTWYDDGAAGFTCHSQGRVYSVGIFSGGCSSTYDATTRSTMLRAVNWTSATSTNGGVALDGYQLSDLNTSYFLSAKPAYFGNLAWPPYDPSRGSSATKTSIPAGYRYVNGSDPPAGTANLPPIAIAAALPLAGILPLPVVFSSLGSLDPEGATLTFHWDFGDGTSSTSANPSHTYAGAGVYLAKLTVSDGVNSTTATTLTVSVTSILVNQPPVVAANAPTRSGSAPLTVNFSSAGSSDPEGATLTYNWTFGDGTTSTAANPSKVYSTAGSYTAKLTVSDGTHSTTSGNITITVTNWVNRVPVAVASTTSSSSGVVPLAVTFSSSGSADPDGTNLTYSWNFGDGATSTAANPSHTYSVAGNYQARLTVSDGVNTANSGTISIGALNAGSGLVAAYGFEEGSGTTTADASGNGNTGTINGATWVNGGKYGLGLSFNGTSSLVSINNSASLDLSTGLTVEAWVNPASSSNPWKPVILKPANTTQISYVLQGSTPTGNAPAMYVAPASGNMYGTSALPLNTWSHLVGTYDGTTMRLYVNGVQVTSVAQTGTIPTSTQLLTIGGNAVFGDYWKGVIDEVRIYNRALTASEIQADMATPLGPNGTPVAPPSDVHIVE